jgi:8-oxo-dGTP diphosphatase
MVAKCVGAILLYGERLLLGRRASHRRSHPDCWDIIGGHVQIGEALEQALVREVEEEIGVTPVDYEQLTSLQFDDGLEGVADLHIYCVRAWRGGAPTIRDNEHVELRWFTIESACELTNLASPEYRNVFRTTHSLTNARPARQ